MLFPGGLHELALYLCEAFDGRDRETNTRHSDFRVGPSRPTVHGLAAYYAQATHVDLRRVEETLVKAGFDLGATIKFNAAESAHQTDRNPRN